MGRFSRNYYVKIVQVLLGLYHIKKNWHHLKVFSE